MNKPTLYIMTGLSGSGKSSVAAEIASIYPDTVIVSSDAIREELTGNYKDQEHNEKVFKIFHDRIRKNLENKKNVIADATNLTMKSRRAIMMKVNGLNIRKVCVVIPKPFELCKEDNLHRKYPVPNSVLDKQIRRFQIPFYEEGFDDIQVIPFEKHTDMLKVIHNMKNFDQKTPWHDKTLGNHCLQVAELFSNCSYGEKYELPAICHDIGKLFTQSFDENGVAHYYGHPEYGSYLMLSNFHGFFEGLTDGDILDMCFLVNYHMLPFDWNTDKSKEKWKKIFGEYKYQMLLDFNKCDKVR